METASENDTVKISEDEAALYDRQIRLWGLEAQNKLRKSKILIIGAGGLGAEVAKNLVLTGVKELTIVDDREATSDNCVAQFLISKEDMGKNRAEASLQKLKQLNPMVTVNSLNEKLLNSSVDLQQFDVVCLTDCSLEEISQVNKECHRNNIKFLFGKVWGIFGCILSDLQTHEYVYKKKVHMEGTVNRNKISQNEQLLEVMNKDSVTYPSFQEIISIDWTDDSHQMKVKSLDIGYFLFQILLQFEMKYSRKLTNSNEDFQTLVQLKNTFLQSLKLSPELISDEMLRGLNGEVSPVCAIIGGILAEEVVKSVSHKDLPLNNFFFYHALKGIGIVETVKP